MKNYDAKLFKIPYKKGKSMRNKLAVPLIAVLLALGSWLLPEAGRQGETGSIPALVNSTNYIRQDVPEYVSEIKKEGIRPLSYIEAKVVKVSDGDTVEIEYKGKSYKVRLLCIDTPESVKSGVEVQLFGKEASRFTEEMLLGKGVKLVFDKGLKDRYERLLAYIVLDEDVFFNGVLVRNGFARVNAVSPNKGLEDYFYELMDMAMMEKLGFWGLDKDERPFIENDKGNLIPRYYEEEAA